MPLSRLLRVVLCLLVGVLACVRQSWAQGIGPVNPLAASLQPPEPLKPDNLCLIVNSNDPLSEPLARFYAQQRKVPEGRIIKLNLPVSDDISAADFEAKVVPDVRAYLKDSGLERKVTCLVTFYGVPLRVGGRRNTQAEDAEYAALEKALVQHAPEAATGVEELETLAAEIQPGFKKRLPDEITALQPRAAQAFAVISNGLTTDNDAERRKARAQRAITTLSKLLGEAEATSIRARTPFDRILPDVPTPEQLARFEQSLRPVVAEMTTLRTKVATNLEARVRLRELTALHGGLLRLVPMLAEHKGLVETRETTSAFDSELACLWWPDARPRYRWHDNPLFHRTRIAMARPGANRLPPGLMVMRIDAPTEPLARKLIETSIRVENGGLLGRLALDARGKPETDAYGKFDQSIRRAAEFFKANSRVQVELDDAEPVFKPGAVNDVALYCGWYSLRNYVPGLKFAPGAIGYHVASLELISLHNEWEKGWVRGLMNDGVVGTLGAVAEPYLHSFPQPDEFYPLLATGKMTLAEAYWATNPLVSWMNTCIGDPLYKPYAANPAIKVDDLPANLRTVVPQ